ncbi:MAG: caspase family protein [Alphaproteobacteria bacterium]|nr:caspase family protein [Alphaproteobacteria bacterium]
MIRFSKIAAMACLGPLVAGCEVNPLTVDLGRGLNYSRVPVEILMEGDTPEMVSQKLKNIKHRVIENQAYGRDHRETWVFDRYNTVAFGPDQVAQSVHVTFVNGKYDPNAHPRVRYGFPMQNTMAMGYGGQMGQGRFIPMDAPQGMGPSQDGAAMNMSHGGGYAAAQPMGYPPQQHKQFISLDEMEDMKAREHADARTAADIPDAVRADSAPVSGVSGFPLDASQFVFKPALPHPDDVAVIVANGHYGGAADFPDVTPAYADADGMKVYAETALGIPAANILTLRDANLDGMRDAFGDALRDRVKRRVSNVFVYFSGHGAVAGKDGEALLAVGEDGADPRKSAYPLKTLYTTLEGLRAQSVTVVLEACFPGDATKSVTPPDTVTVLKACATGQSATWDPGKSHGLFTKTFLRAMSGEADRDQDGKVSGLELEFFLTKTVTNEAMKGQGNFQMPDIHIAKGS